jgi:uncharacterized membrane protein YidH (DUF202 family)
VSRYTESDEPLAGERTDLAWTRSGIAFAVCVAIVLRRVWPLDESGDLLAVGLVGVGAMAWAVGLVVARRVARTTHGGRDVMDARTLRTITAGTFVLALGAFVLGMFPAPG